MFGIAKLTGYEGTFEFLRIGQDYISELGMQYLSFRLFSAFMGAAIVPLTFLWLNDVGLSLSIVAMVCFFMSIDNALIVTSKFMTSDAPFYTLCFFSCFFLHKSRIVSAGSPDVTIWALLAGFSIGLALATRYAAFYTTFLFSICLSLFEILQAYRAHLYQGFKLGAFIRNKLGCFVVLPLLVYISVFYWHFEILYKTGLGDKYFTADFQASLEGSKYNPHRKGNISFLVEFHL